MVTISQRRPMLDGSRDRPPNMTGFLLCTLLAVPFWGAVLAVVL